MQPLLIKEGEREKVIFLGLDRIESSKLRAIMLHGVGATEAHNKKKERSPILTL